MSHASRFPLIAGAALILGSLPSTAQDRTPRSHEEMHRLHQDPQAYIAMLEDPKRDEYQKPNEVVEALDLKPGETIADIGSGSGYFALRFAAHVRDEGRVLAVDIDPEMIRYLNRRVRDAGVRNVQTILAEPADPLLPDASVDRFVVVDTWHHIEKPLDYLARMKRILKPGGQVVMIDYHKRELPVGPPVEIKIARDELVRQMEANGFQLAKEHTFLPYQYFIVFELA